ncbi:von Willebrand factor A domain-containing protein 7 [Oryzias melastigma]|uniref:von Willebrand factor A domain-containing protein 7 n=1 Tax=Oryzias melastigma TaxID=30732 RepID=A0A834BXM1_ORYME|nr:von Willebrand factor A domain-containing protein 7 [Oryzias melastigma]
MTQEGWIKAGSGKQVLWFIFAYLPLLPLPSEGFLPNFWSRVLTLSWDSHTHQYMTEQAILTVTLEVLRDVSDQNRALAEDEVRLGRAFWRAVGEVVSSNADTDFTTSTQSNPVYHFDSERIKDSIAMLRQLWTQTVLSVRAKEYQSARYSLGQLFHSLQDFYSHSNWVEMGQKSIYLHLMQPEELAIPVAPEDKPTCSDCFTATCRNNLLPAVTHTQLLTSGYPSSSISKPHGKCSHGGILDKNTALRAKGGINKDSTSPVFSPHHYLHKEAAALATEATQTVLRDLKDTVGDEALLRLFSVKQKPALVFVLDTTGSMFEEITAARLRAHSIIQSRTSSLQQTSTFVLVPFHDPDVGPVYEEEDPNTFMQHLENLIALGGGDEPEMCLSAILLALTHSPPLSDIFVFTDASPKDAHLFDAVKALALKKQSKITFLLTEDPYYTPGRKRRKRRSKEPLPSDRFSLYSSLSSLSGGLTIFTTDLDIQEVSAIVEDNTAADKVTLLHVEGGPELISDYSFRVDSSVKKVILHITGTLAECILTSPSDQSQSLLSGKGPLAELEPSQGLYRISLLLPVQSGHWKLRVVSEGHVTFNVIGDSTVDFLYYFATLANETHPGLARVEGSPIAGAPAFLVMYVTSLDSDTEVSFSHVTLLGAKGERLQQVKLDISSSSSFQAWREVVGLVESVPTVPFCVQLSGRDSTGNEVERVSTEMVHPTHVKIQVSAVPSLVPGHISTVGFEILNHGPARLFTLTADDDCDYLQMKGAQRFPVAEQGLYRSEVNLLTPATARAGATVTLTLTVHDLDSPDSNYAVVYLTVIPPHLDTSPPSCSVARVQSECPSVCTQSSWSVSLVVSDNGRSGLAALQLQKGEGILTLFHNAPFLEDVLDESGNMKKQTHKDKKTSEDHHHRHHHHHSDHKTRLKTGDPPLNISAWAHTASQPLWVDYTSSCCSAQAEVLVWDRAGNTKRCRLTSVEQRSSDRSSDTSGTAAAEFTSIVVSSLLWFLLV